mgnify:CR=1 FL=1
MVKRRGLFIFAPNNPIKYTDPDGRWISEFDADPSEAMYELMAGYPDCPECETPLGPVFTVTASRIWPFMKEQPKPDPVLDANALNGMKEARAEEQPFVPASGAITHDNTLVELFFGPEDLVLMGAMKVFAVVPFIIKANGKIAVAANSAKSDA